MSASGHRFSGLAVVAALCWLAALAGPFMIVMLGVNQVVQFWGFGVPGAILGAVVWLVIGVFAATAVSRAAVRRGVSILALLVYAAAAVAVLLAGGSSMLMLAFLMPTSPRPSPSPIVGRLGSQAVHVDDLRGAHADLVVLDSLRRSMGTPHPAVRVDQAMFANKIAQILNMLDDRQRDLHWYLLLHEARSGGSAVPAADVARLLLDLNLDAPGGGGPARGDSEAASAMRQAIGDLLTVDQYWTRKAQAQAIPDHEIRDLLERLDSRITVRWMNVDASQIPSAAPLTDEEIRGQYEAYRDVLPGAVDPPEIKRHRYPFGYKQPDRVQVEYMKFDVADIRRTLRVEASDVREAYKYYEEHRDEFAHASTTAAAGPSTGPGATTAGVKSFDEVRQVIVERMLDRRAEMLMRQMVEMTQAYLNASFPQRDEKGYVETADASRWPSMETASVQVQRRFQFMPRYVQLNRLLDDNGLRQLDGIGHAFLQSDGQGLPGPDFATLALHVRELDANPRVPAFRGLQAGVCSPAQPLKDVNGNQYLYRVVRVSPAHTPESVDEVRNEVVADVMRLRGYEQGQQLAERLAAEAEETGLAAVARRCHAQLREPAPFAPLRMGLGGEPECPGVDGIGVDPVFIDKALELCQAKGRKVAVCASEQSLQVRLIERVAFTPATLADPVLRARAEAIIRGRLIRTMLRDQWPFQVTRARLRYTPATTGE